MRCQEIVSRLEIFPESIAGCLACTGGKAADHQQCQDYVSHVTLFSFLTGYAKTGINQDRLRLKRDIRAHELE